MNAPEDFGLSAAATAAHVSDATPAEWHAPFWAAWQAELWAGVPRLLEHPPGDPSDPGVTHQFESVGRCRIGARLLAARDAEGRAVVPRAGVVVVHGYEGVEPLAKEEERHAGLARRGVAVLLVRVRGFAGSQLDAGALDKSAMGYITVGLEGLMHKPQDALAWVLPRAVADVANACRAMAGYLREAGAVGAPVSLRGESFGAGLAVVAAAQLAAAGGEREGRGEVSRLVLAVPSLGDWPWRLALEEGRVPRAGMNREVRELMIREAHREGELAQVLRLCDAVVHARGVRCPVLAKLALRDDLVPAPTQAGVFNALGAARGFKHRFAVRFGHYDGGLANARRHAAFEPLAADFLDPSMDPNR